MDAICYRCQPMLAAVFCCLFPVNKEAEWRSIPYDYTRIKI